MTYQAFFFCILTCALLLGGCAPKDVLIIEVDEPVSNPIPSLPGVDSIFTAMAVAFQSRGMLVDPGTSASTRRAVEGGRRLFQIADSLISQYEIDQDTVVVSDQQRALSIERFNEGAETLQNPQLGLKELREAAEMFQSALDLNPYDEEALYWLSRVYELQAEKLMDTGALSEMVVSVTNLVELNPMRHDYAALLASAYEATGTESGWADAGAWWHRASVLVRDAPDLALTPTTMDTATVFIYLANASRAFAEADQGDLALGSIDEAMAFAVGKEEMDYIQSEREWLTWDAQLSTRKMFDQLITTSIEYPDSASIGLRTLLEQVTLPQAEVDVRHQLSLALFNAGNLREGIQEIQQAWSDVQSMDESIIHRVREDYGTMAYSLAMEHRNRGELRNALAYLLQSEATGFSGAPLSSLTRSILLRTDPEAALEAAQLAERGWDQLDPSSQRTLLEHMVAIHRRLNNRDEAADYAQRYRNF